MSRTRRLIQNFKGNVIGIGMLRPGYTDHLGRKSDGVRGETVGDNYDEPRIEKIAGAIKLLRAEHNATKVIVAGHSGGSAITAKLIALKPGLVDHAFIVSCPCNINAWRADMLKKTQYRGFSGDLDISSPVDVVNEISDDTGITMFVGESDEVTKPYLSREYKTALSRSGKEAELYMIDGDHEIFLDRQVIESVLSKVNEYNQP